MDKSCYLSPLEQVINYSFISSFIHSFKLVIYRINVVDNFVAVGNNNRNTIKVMSHKSVLHILLLASLAVSAVNAQGKLAM